MYASCTARAHERFLGEILGQVLVAGHAVGQAEDAVHVGVVDGAFGAGVAPLGPGDELGFGHGGLVRVSGCSSCSTTAGAKGFAENSNKTPG